MNGYLRRLCVGVFGLVLVGALTGSLPAVAQSVTPEETTRSVRRMLERLPYYGGFDFIVFRVDRGTVYLAGYSFDGRLKADAEMAVKRGLSSVPPHARLRGAAPVTPGEEGDRRARG